MRGIISINFICDDKIYNRYPVIIYYNGDESKILDSIKKELLSYIKDVITLKSYTKASLYVVTYFTNDDNINTKEYISKYTWKIEDIYPLSDNEDICSSILNNFLSNIDGNTSIENILQCISQHNISSTTIINYMRYKMQINHYKRNDIDVLLNFIKKRFEIS